MSFGFEPRHHLHSSVAVQVKHAVRNDAANFGAHARIPLQVLCCVDGRAWLLRRLKKQARRGQEQAPNQKCEHQKALSAEIHLISLSEAMHEA